MKRIDLKGKAAGQIVTDYIKKHGGFTSVSGITYKARLSGNTIYYQGGNRNQGAEELMEIEDFVHAYDAVKHLEKVNTNTIKYLIPGRIYRKRTPFIAMLMSAGLI